MIAERGLPGFALTNVGAEAGVSRGLANYHFADRGELLRTALAGLLEDEPGPEGHGLTSLFSWMAEQSQRAARRDPKLLALLQLAVGPGVEAEASALREAYWSRRSQLIQRHLSAAQALQQVRDDLEPSDLAAVLLGLLHGELLRIAATGDGPSAAFTALIECALAPERPAAKGPPKVPPPHGVGGAQGNLFEGPMPKPG
ncbi:TetR/AcrR family transcriptional regulator [Phenylobacterium sp. LjRoot219]